MGSGTVTMITGAIKITTHHAGGLRMGTLSAHKVRITVICRYVIDEGHGRGTGIG